MQLLHWSFGTEAQGRLVRFFFLEKKETIH